MANAVRFSESRRGTRSRPHDVRTGPSPESGIALQYPTDIVLLAVLWRLRYTLSFRDVAALLLERGFGVTHETIRIWEFRLAPLLGDKLRAKRRGRAGVSWSIDETSVKVAGRWCSLYRASDRDGDLLWQTRAGRAGACERNPSGGGGRRSASGTLFRQVGTESGLHRWLRVRPDARAGEKDHRMADEMSERLDVAYYYPCTDSKSRLTGASSTNPMPGFSPPATD